MRDSVNGHSDKERVKDEDTDDFPVENVSHDEAKEFCEKLSALAEEKAEKRLYRLPTEAEWEYSCRGGGDGYKKFGFGDRLTKDDANFDESKLGRTCKVGSYKANAFGLHDMHGNVWEWFSDWSARYPATGDAVDPTGPEQGSGRVVRGGASRRCRSACRDRYVPAVRYVILGFRVVLVPRR